MKLWALQGFTLLLSTSTFVQMFPSVTGADGTMPTNAATSTTVTDTTNTATPTTVTDKTNSATSTTVTDKTTSITSAPTTNIISTTSTDSITIVPDVHCAGKQDFDPCDNPENAGCKENSKCSCKKQKYFCRCNNDKEKWYIGEDCEQEWTVLTFALVASLPGVALATVVGVAVHCVHHSRKKGPAASVESSKTQKVDPNPSSSKKESSPMDDYSNLVFASDLQNGQKPQPASRSPHDSIPMASQPYSAYRNPSYRNPYASSQPSRNPYSSLDRYDGYKNPIEPPGLQNSIARGNQSGYQQAGPPTPLYSSPDYDSSRPQFPRVQMGRQY
ncbi:uncharacterized protein zgc:158432 [Anguilla rostrata]|uniref:uncharacterized protein zgc:158432 n=1 Tax=Anguilla rostrata TaxID=7938 RepID=UPI0030D5395B